MPCDKDKCLVRYNVWMTFNPPEMDGGQIKRLQEIMARFRDKGPKRDALPDCPLLEPFDVIVTEWVEDSPRYAFSIGTDAELWRYKEGRGLVAQMLDFNWCDASMLVNFARSEESKAKVTYHCEVNTSHRLYRSFKEKAKRHFPGLSDELLDGFADLIEPLCDWEGLLGDNPSFEQMATVATEFYLDLENRPEILFSQLEGCLGSGKSAQDAPVSSEEGPCPKKKE